MSTLRSLALLVSVLAFGWLGVALAFNGTAFGLVVGACLIAAAFGLFALLVNPPRREPSAVDLMAALAKLRRERAEREP